MKRVVRTVFASWGLTLLSLAADPAQACSVCFGDGDSPLAKGALAGVAVLGFIIYGLLFGFVGVALSWHRRAKKLNNAKDL